MLKPGGGGEGKIPYRTPAPWNALPGQASRAGRREVEDGSRGRESGLSGWIIYEEGYAGETALLIRVPEKGLGGVNNRGESRRDSEVWEQKGQQERGRKRKRRPKRAGWNRRRLAGLEL